MIDHLTLTVRDMTRSKAFYAAALAPLGAAVRMDFGDTCGIGPEGKPAFWLKAGEVPTPPMHIAFTAGDRGQVDAFHAAALQAGAADNGQPGLRPHYHADYYGAFVIDPDGHNIEVVCHRSPVAAAKPEAAAATAPARAAKARRPAPAKKAAKARKPARKVAKKATKARARRR